MRQATESRTRSRLIAAFNQLVFDKTRGPIRVGQIIARAGVGRSTFYDHFANAEAVHMAALARPLAPLADAISGTGTIEGLEWMLDHFQGNKARARETMTGGSRDRMARLLATMIADRVEPAADAPLPIKLASMQIAEAMLAAIRLWIMGEAPASPRALAQSLFATAEAMRAALRLEPIGPHDR